MNEALQKHVNDFLKYVWLIFCKYIKTLFINFLKALVTLNKHKEDPSRFYTMLKFRFFYYDNLYYHKSIFLLLFILI